MPAFCHFRPTRSPVTCWASTPVFCGIVLPLFSLACGCSGRPPALSPPGINPSYAADEAIALYDQDGSDDLSEEELRACPGMLVALETYDTNGDGKISREEIEARLQKFVESKVALTQLVAVVRLGKRPLSGATVRFVPEAFLGDSIKPATGVTGKSGGAMMDVADSDLPSNQAGLVGIQFGTYRVEITHPEESIPSRYNTNTELGYDTLPGAISVAFDLKSR